jgi:hypothetical protein
MQRGNSGNVAFAAPITSLCARFLVKQSSIPKIKRKYTADQSYLNIPEYEVLEKEQKASSEAYGRSPHSENLTEGPRIISFSRHWLLFICVLILSYSIPIIDCPVKDSHKITYICSILTLN